MGSAAEAMGHNCELICFDMNIKHQETDVQIHQYHLPDSQDLLSACMLALHPERCHVRSL